MPTKQGKPPASYYKNDLTIDQSTNVGVDATARRVQDGAGVNTSMFLSREKFSIKPNSTDSTSTLLVMDKDSNAVIAIDSVNDLVKVGASQISATTLFKEMGLYEFSPNAAGNHYPLIANRVGMQGAEGITYDDDWGNGTDPSTTLDVSGLTDPENAIAVYWYLENDITLDSVRYMCRSDGVSERLNFHLFSYDLDVSTNYGDLSGGVVCANAYEENASAHQVRTGTFTLDSADIDAGKIVIGFAEALSSDDFSVHFNIKYHIR